MQNFTYTIKSRKGARGIRITVSADGAVVVTKPRMVPRMLAEAFVQSRTDWIEEQIRNAQKRPKKLLAHYSAKDYKENKDHAYALVHNKVIHFNQFYSFPVKGITVRNQKTRWGSCSSQGKLNFNYKLVFLPEELQDYVVVHELCHLKEMNHSKRFWDLVAACIPDHEIRRKKIKLY